MIGLIAKSVLSVFLFSLQLQLHMPPVLQIVTNDSTLSFSPEWITGVLSNLPHRKPDYAIVAFYTSENICYTKLRMPQTATRTRVIENILLYYLMMDNEEDRCSEILLIYPYFVPVTQPPFISVSYQTGGQIIVKFNRWQTVPVPAEPSRLEMEIYNFILQKYFEKFSTMDTIPEEIFKAAGIKFSLPVTKIKAIYQKVFLWKKHKE